MRMKMMVLALLMTQAGHAAVTDVASNGFTLVQSAEIAAPPDKIYAALIQPSRWWSSDHTFSGNAANLSLDARAGGCFCETLTGGGSVQHLAVVYAVPGKTLRLVGMLGPFQGIAGNGVMTWTITPGSGGSKLDLTYQVAGYANVSLRGMGYDAWSKAADGMLAEQFERLKRSIETGSPDAKSN